jgi:transcriptional regulator NrdR family protein
MRFASVYRGFESLADFEAEIVALRSARKGAGREDARALTP